MDELARARFCVSVMCPPTILSPITPIRNPSVTVNVTYCYTSLCLEGWRQMRLHKHTKGAHL